MRWLRGGLESRLLLVFAASACAVTLVDLARATSGRLRTQPHWGATSTPLPPPPAWATPQALSRFYVLFVAYAHLPAADKPSFSEWLDLNGVTNPHLKAQMLALYTWYLGQLRGGPPVS